MESVTLLVGGRRVAGISQEKLADRLERRQQFVSKYESGERRLDIVEFVDIARALKLDGVKLLSEIADE